MARKPTTTPAEQIGPDFAGATPADIAEQENRVRTMQAEAADNAQALAAQLGYDGILTVGAVEDEIRHFQGRASEAAFEMGKRLLLLRELTPHGEFEKRVDLMGINYRFAARLMQTARKFSKVSTSTLLKAAGTHYKMLELTVLDDSEIVALEAGETVRNLNTDKIETMSVRELKAALRAKNEEVATKERQIASKDSKINELDARLNHKPVPTYDAVGNEVFTESPEEKSIALREEIFQESANVEMAIMGSLRLAIAALLEHGEAHAQPHEDFIVGLVCQIEVALSRVRGQFGLKAEPTGDERPDWVLPGAEEAAAKNLAKTRAQVRKAHPGAAHV